MWYLMLIMQLKRQENLIFCQLQGFRGVFWLGGSINQTFFLVLHDTCRSLKEELFQTTLKIICADIFMYYKIVMVLIPPEVEKVVNPVILDDRKYIQNQALAENISKT